MKTARKAFNKISFIGNKGRRWFTLKMVIWQNVQTFFEKEEIWGKVSLKGATVSDSYDLCTLDWSSFKDCLFYQHCGLYFAQPIPESVYISLTNSTKESLQFLASAFHSCHFIGSGSLLLFGLWETHLTTSWLDFRQAWIFFRAQCEWNKFHANRASLTDLGLCLADSIHANVCLAWISKQQNYGCTSTEA